MAARPVEHNTAVPTHVNGHSTLRGGGLRAAAPVVSDIDMFISRLDPTTTEDQLIRHLQTRGFGQCAVGALVTKHDSYASFKVKIPVKKFKSFRMPSMWPECVYVRKFYRLKSSINDVASLCENHDVILLQETWLLPHDMCLLQNVHNEFYGEGVSSVDTTGGILIGCPYGGLAVLWRKSQNAFIKGS